jgi:hypothetical protein
MSQISTLSSFGKEIFDLTDSASGREAAELHALRIQRHKLHVIYTQVLPKVVPGLIGDLLSREIEYGPGNPPMYTIEVFTKKGTDSKKAIGFQSQNLSPCCQLMECQGLSSLLLLVKAMLPLYGFPRLLHKQYYLQYLQL